MRLLTVIIADDDYLVIEDLKKTIAWQELGYRVIATATNGLDALELVQRHRPDLLITDIIMPSMTGLELIERIRPEHPDMQILIISSYDEFEYAKSAIKHGVADYILKTQITPLSFSQRLMRLSQESIARRQRDRAALRQSLRDYFDRRLAEPLSPNITPTLYAASRYHYWFLIIGSHLPFFTDRQLYESEVNEAIAKISETISAQFGYSDIPVRFTYGSFLILGFVATHDTSSSYSSIRSVTEQLSGILRASLPRPFTIFANSDPCVLSELRLFYFRNHPKLAFHTAFSSGQVIGWQEIEEEKHDASREYFHFDSLPWEGAVLQEKLTRLTEYLKDRIAGYDLNALVENHRMLHNYLGGEQQSYFGTPDAFIRHMQDMILSGTDRDSDRAEYPQSVHMAIRYIRENFGDHEIGVQNIAEHADVSAGRLGVLFRQYLGKSINEYLTDVRIENAVHLLSHTSLKIYEVSDRCGFNAPHYFSDIMYKKTGKRPIDYKRLPAAEE